MIHVRIQNANIEPVFFAYPDNTEINAIVKKYTDGKPEYDFVAPDDGFGHHFWVIDNDEEPRYSRPFLHSTLPTVTTGRLQPLS